MGINYIWTVLRILTRQQTAIMAIAGSCSDYKQITMPIDTPLAASYACIYGGHSGVRSVTDLDWSYML